MMTNDFVNVKNVVLHYLFCYHVLIVFELMTTNNFVNVKNVLQYHLFIRLLYFEPFELHKPVDGSWTSTNQFGEIG